MKIDDLIKRLEEIKTKHGNLDVVCYKVGVGGLVEEEVLRDDEIRIREAEADPDGYYRRVCGVETDKFIIIG